MKKIKRTVMLSLSKHTLSAAKSLFIALLITLSLPKGYAQTGDVRARRVIADQAIQLRGTRIDSIQKDTANWATKTSSVPTAKSVYDFVKANSPVLDTTILSERINRKLTKDLSDVNTLNEFCDTCWVPVVKGTTNYKVRGSYILSPPGNYGNILLNRNGQLAAMGEDSFTLNQFGILECKMPLSSPIYRVVNNDSTYNYDGIGVWLADDFNGSLKSGLFDENNNSIASVNYENGAIIQYSYAADFIMVDGTQNVVIISADVEIGQGMQIAIGDPKLTYTDYGVYAKKINGNSYSYKTIGIYIPNDDTYKFADDRLIVSDLGLMLASRPDRLATGGYLTAGGMNIGEFGLYSVANDGTLAGFNEAKSRYVYGGSEGVFWINTHDSAWIGRDLYIDGSNGDEISSIKLFDFQSSTYASLNVTNGSIWFAQANAGNRLYIPDSQDGDYLVSKRTSVTNYTYDFPSTAAQTSSEATVTITGAGLGNKVIISASSIPANSFFSGYVSASNTVKIRFDNYSAASIDPASINFHISVID